MTKYLALTLLHIFLILWAYLIVYRPTLRRIIFMFTIGAVIVTVCIMGFAELYAKLEPEKPNEWSRHLYAIILYGFIMAIASAISKKREKNKKQKA